MRAIAPALDQWRRAYELAAEIRDLAPWTWMRDTDHLGFEDPEDGSPRFISVMGREGEHYAVAVYRRVEDLFRIMDLVRDPGEVSDGILETSQLQLSFEDRDFLDAADRQVIKRLGLTFRGRQSWPCFRSYLPGQFPWFVDRDELRQLTLALEQVLAVAPRFRDDEDGLECLNRMGMDEHVFLMRTPVSTAGTVEWQESMVRIERPASPEIVPEGNEFLLQRAVRFPAVENTLEVDLRPAPSPVQERKGQRPYFPWIMLVVESGQGFIVGHEMLVPVPTLDAVYSRAAGALLDVLASQQIRPAEILVRSERVAALFRAVCGKLDTRLTVRPSLPRAEDAFTSLLRFFDGG
ncbi:MAG: hypothetical protein JXR77_01295 [Lentisphaeria bacterium]|nr:hypothetical protein [Lentisphaeria bacterium]